MLGVRKPLHRLADNLVGESAAGQGGHDLGALALGQLAGVALFDQRHGSCQFGAVALSVLRSGEQLLQHRGGGVPVDALGVQILRDLPPAFSLAQQLGGTTAGIALVVQQAQLFRPGHRGGGTVGVKLAAEFLVQFPGSVVPQCQNIQRPVDGLAGIALAAQLLTVPVVLYDFHRLPLYFVPANLLVTPLLEWAIIAGLLAALFAWAVPPLAGGLLQGTDYLLWAALRLNANLAALPRASLPAGGMAGAETALYYGALLLARTARWWRQAPRRLAGAAALAGALLAGCGWSYASRPEMELFVPDLGSSRAAVWTDGTHAVVYYRDGGLPMDMGERELRSVLEYKGLFHADVFIGDFRRSRGASPFTLAMPIGEIWLPEGTADEAAGFTAGHPESRVRFYDRARFRLSGGLSAETDGESWYFEMGDDGWYIDGGSGPMEDVAPTAHRLWLGGAEPFRPAVNRDTMKWFRPEAAVYAGGRSEHAGEDRDYFLLCGIPVGDPYLDGMVTLARRGGAWTMEKYSPSGLTDDFFALE